MKRRAVSLLLFVVLLAPVALTAAEPIIKPKKYHGPIPRSSFALRVGFLGGPDNAEMIEALDKKLTGPEKDASFSEDFGNGLSIDGTYVYKLHPQFAFRANLGASFLRTDGEGAFVASAAELPDSVDASLLNYQRNFDVDLFSVEASAIYYFADAAIQEFQTYVGGGFSAGIPHAKFLEVRVDDDTGETVQEIDRDRWSFEPAVHVLGGASYFVTNTWAINAEARGQIMQSKFPIDVFDQTAGRLEEVDVIVKYSGFLFTIGAMWAF
jgi:opacity protein-like surface antigen